MRDAFARPERHPYGDHRLQSADLYVPRGEGPHRVVILIHGGSWQARYGRWVMRLVAADLVRRGVAVWNVGYRRLGRGEGGGWPATFDDVAAAVDALAGPVRDAAGELPLDRVVAVGHSAGGHLVAWLAARRGLPSGAPGAEPRVVLRGAVSQAGVLDLVDAFEQRLGRDAVRELLGGPPAAFPDRYALASPIARVPIGVPVIGVHGTADDRVPVRQTERFAAASGDRWTRLDGVDHFAVIDPTTAAWAACRAALEELLA